MALTESIIKELGSNMPSFELVNVISGQKFSSNEIILTKGILVMFICNHCPYVKSINTALSSTCKIITAMGIQVIAICSNNVDTHPEDSPENLKKQALEFGFTFPYLYDESQAVAKAFNAVCTPDFFLYDSKLSLVYRGRFDESRPGNGIVPSGRDLLNATKELADFGEISLSQFPSIGCNIKWK